MKLKYGSESSRVFEVDINSDYFLDNGACIQLVSTDHEKHKFVDWSHITHFVFSKARFQKLLKGGFIRKAEGISEHGLTYYRFTKLINDYSGEFR